MTDSKVRPVECTASDVVQYYKAGKIQASVDVIEARDAAVRAKAEVAGYRRAVGDCADLCEQVACGSKLNIGERYIAGRCAELIRARFGGEG
jgi:hypothetical protein